MRKHKIAYQIRKTSVEKGFSTILNDSLGAVLEFEIFEQASQLCTILNSNSDNNCRYELIVVDGTPKARYDIT